MGRLHPLERRRLALCAPISLSHWVWATVVVSEDKKREVRRFSSADGILWGRVASVNYCRIVQWKKDKQGSCLGWRLATAWFLRKVLKLIITGVWPVSSVG